MNKDVWTVSVNKDHEVYIVSDDHTHDVTLKVEGTFGELDDLVWFASNLARKLNGTLDDSLGESAQ
jgi:hypothetical protein